MSDTMQSVLFLMLSIILVLLGLTAVEWARNLPFLNPSRKHMRDLVAGLEDLLLPLGSFPSELLRRWAPTVSKKDLTLTVPPTYTIIPPITTMALPDGSEAGELHQNEAEQQQQVNSTAVLEDIQQEEETTAAVIQVSTESQSFEKALRELVDPEGTSGPDLQNLVKLVADTIKGRAEAEKKLKSEAEDFGEREQALKDGWRDKEAEFEQTAIKNSELVVEVDGLRHDNTNLKEKRQCKLDEYNSILKTSNAGKEAAEERARTAETRANERINAVRERYEKEKADSELENLQDRNSRLCLQKMDLNDRNRRHLRQAEEQHQTAMDRKDKTINRLEAKIKQMTTAATVAEEVAKERAASDKQRLKDRLEVQIKEKDTKIGTLEQQLGKSDREIGTLKQCESKAKGAERINERLSERLRDEKATLRENHQYILNDSKLEIQRLLRTIETNEASISTLRESITSLEGGEELRKLKIQLKESQKKLGQSSKNAQAAREQLQTCKREMEKLQSDIKARDTTIVDEAKKASEAKDALRKQLEEAARIANEGLEKEVQELGKQKSELSRKLETAHSENQLSRTNVQRLEEEKQRIATDNQQSIKERDEEIRRVQDTKDALDAKMNEARETARKLERDHDEQKKKAVEDAVRKVADEAKDQAREHERIEQMAVEKAAKDAAESVKQTPQKEVEDEMQDCPPNPALETPISQNPFRQEILKPRVSKRPMQSGPATTNLQNPIPTHSTDPVTSVISPKSSDQIMTDVTSKAVAEKEPMQTRSVKINLQNSIPTHSTDPVASVFSPKSSDQVMTDVTPKAVAEKGPTQTRSAKTNLQTPTRMSFADLLASVSSPKSSDQAMTDAVPTPVSEKRPTQAVPAKTSQQNPIRISFADIVASANSAKASDQAMTEAIPTTISKKQQTQSVPVKTNLQSPIPTPSAGLFASVKWPESFSQVVTAASPKPAAKDNNASGTTPVAKAQSPLPGLQSEPEASTAPVAKAQSPLPGLQSELEASTAPFSRPMRVPRSRIRQLAPQGQQPGSQKQVMNPEQGGSSSPFQQDDGSDKPSNWTADMTGTATEMLRQGDDIELVEETVRELFEVQEADIKGWDTWLKKLQSKCEAEKKGKTEKI